MTLPLPARVVDRDIARNFSFLAQRFPLEASVDNFRQFPQARVYHSANQAITNNTSTRLAFNSERWDLGTPSSNMHDTVTNNSRLTCRVAGLYVISACVAWADNGAGHRRLDFVLNNAAYIGGDARLPVTGDTTEQHITTEYRLAVGDYVEAEVFQSSGGNLNVAAAANISPEFMMNWMSP